HRSVTPSGSAWSSSALGKISRTSSATASISSVPTKPSIRTQPSSCHVVTSESLASREVTIVSSLSVGQTGGGDRRRVSLLPEVGEQGKGGPNRNIDPDDRPFRQTPATRALLWCARNRIPYHVHDINPPVSKSSTARRILQDATGLSHLSGGQGRNAATKHRSREGVTVVEVHDTVIGDSVGNEPIFTCGGTRFGAEVVQWR